MMNTTTRKVPFDIYLPTTAGEKPVIAETIEVEVWEQFGEEFLTTESLERIERVRARHMSGLHGAGNPVLPSQTTPKGFQPKA